ncbi:hypothetical protein ID875_21175 [Streptomyces globisporus]|uniref:Uncharacterized protein n=1 Tax=Streptomyces globisporus TaxID=1908 RepID=A0A927BMU4_STRGL|nr:hypothetical protein [Streptomyces globisporus]
MWSRRRWSGPGAAALKDQRAQCQGLLVGALVGLGVGEHPRKKSSETRALGGNRADVQVLLPLAGGPTSTIRLPGSHTVGGGVAVRGAASSALTGRPGPRAGRGR